MLNLTHNAARAIGATVIAGGLAFSLTACGSDGNVNVGVDKDGNVQASVNAPSAVESALDATNPPTVDKDKVSATTVLPLFDKVGGTKQVNTKTPKGGDTIEPLCQQNWDGKNKWYGLQLDKRNYDSSLGDVVHFNIEGQGIGYTPGDKLHFPQADWAAKVGVKLPDCKHFSMDGLANK